MLESHSGWPPKLLLRLRPVAVTVELRGKGRVVGGKAEECVRGLKKAWEGGRRRRGKA